MSAQIAVFGLLTNNVTSTGAVGGRIFYDTAPQLTARPFMLVREVGVIPTNTLGVGGYSSLDICRVQITIASDTRENSVSIGQIVRSILQDVYNVTSLGQNIDWCRFDSQDSYFDDFSAQDGVYVLVQDYKISIKRL
jgi:hypothetical protein